MCFFGNVFIINSFNYIFIIDRNILLQTELDDLKKVLKDGFTEF